MKQWTLKHFKVPLSRSVWHTNYGRYKVLECIYYIWVNYRMDILGVTVYGYSPTLSILHCKRKHLWLVETAGSGEGSLKSGSC